MSRFQSYLRTHRKRLGLTQRELMLLLGCDSDTTVGRYERLSRKPDLKTALACQIIFSVSAHEVFPGIYAPVEEAVIERVRLLIVEISAARQTARRDYKLETLQDIVDRLSGAR